MGDLILKGEKVMSKIVKKSGFRAFSNVLLLTIDAVICVMVWKGPCQAAYFSFIDAFISFTFSFALMDGMVCCICDE